MVENAPMVFLSAFPLDLNPKRVAVMVGTACLSTRARRSRWCRKCYYRSSDAINGHRGGPPAPAELLTNYAKEIVSHRVGGGGNDGGNGITCFAGPIRKFVCEAYHDTFQVSVCHAKFLKLPDRRN